MVDILGFKRFDDPNIVGTVLLTVPFVAYGIIVNKQYKHLRASTARVQILSTRTALFLPIYALLVWLILIFPHLGPGMEVPLAFCEGCAFYSFFAMLIANLGGPDATLKLQDNANKTPYCGCPKDYLKFYNRVMYALYQFCVYRPIVQVGFALSTYFDQPKVALIFSGIAFVQVVYGFGSLFCFYENISDASANVYGGCKFFLIKVSVGIIVIQGIVEQILLATNSITIDSNETYSSESRQERILSLIILAEYVVLSCIAVHAFGAQLEASEYTDRTLGVAGLAGDQFLSISLGEFLKRVFRFSDTLADLEPGSQQLEEALLSNYAKGFDTRLL